MQPLVTERFVERMESHTKIFVTSRKQLKVETFSSDPLANVELFKVVLFVLSIFDFN